MRKKEEILQDMLKRFRAYELKQEDKKVREEIMIEVLIDIRDHLGDIIRSLEVLEDVVLPKK